MNWKWVYDAFEPSQERLRETLCTLGNGYFATRGAAPEADADACHYPGTYFAGGYNRATTHLHGRDIENEDLVNFPNWLSLKFRVDDSGWVDLSHVEVLGFKQVLDLRAGELTRECRLNVGRGRRLKLHQRRMVHMRRPHLAVLETTFEAENFEGTLTIQSSLEGRLLNSGVARYRDLTAVHLESVAASAIDENTVYLEVKTRQSGLHVGMAARLRCWSNGHAEEMQWKTETEAFWVAQEVKYPLAVGKAWKVEKTVALYTSRDRAIADCRTAAIHEVQTTTDTPGLWREHRTSWRHLWQRFDIRMHVLNQTAEIELERTLRLHIFHLLQTVSIHSLDLDVGVPARGLHGEAYRGHVFWDELFIFPFLNWRLPEITKALLRYRYRRLNQARRLAKAAGFEGAMFPWQSGSDGREESQTVHLNPASGRWLPDFTSLQRHVNSAIAYNIWQYVQVTRDMEFLSYAGAEMLLEIARFWASIATLDEASGRYHIHGVMGPDEYHDRLPGSDTPGLSDNSYTNVMAVWVLLRALEVLSLLPASRSRELMESLHISFEECARWEDITRRMTVVCHEDGILSAFQGYETLKELNWAGYRDKYGDIQRLDRILESEGDSTNNYKVSKQADVLMLFYLLSARELSEILNRLGYSFPSNAIQRNIDYYLARTSHGSSLSRVVHAWVMARTQPDVSWTLFKEALYSDVADTQKGTTPEGIHLGAMAGTVDLVQRGYTGISTEGDVLSFSPGLPAHIDCLRLKLKYRGHALTVFLTHTELKLDAAFSFAEPIRIGFSGRTWTLAQGQSLTLPLISFMH